MFTRILVPVDGSALAEKAIHAGAALAKTLNAEVIVFHAAPAFQQHYYPEGMVVDWEVEKEFLKRSRETATQLVEAAASKARAAGCNASADCELADLADQAILKAAEKHHVDLIVMASHGRNAIASLVLGSTTQKVLAHSKLPVLVIR